MGIGSWKLESLGNLPPQGGAGLSLPSVLARPWFPGPDAQLGLPLLMNARLPRAFVVLRAVELPGQGCSVVQPRCSELGTTENRSLPVV